MREFTLTPAIKKAVVLNVMAAYAWQTPLETWKGIPTQEQLVARDRQLKEKKAYCEALEMAISTYKKSTALVTDWPEIEAYLPAAVKEPRKAIKLPTS